MASCNSCGGASKRRQACVKFCGAMLCRDCAATPEGLEEFVNEHDLKAMKVNRCRWCRRKGDPLTGADVRKLQVGDWLWAYYCKDHNPEDVRVNGPYKIVEIHHDSEAKFPHPYMLAIGWAFEADNDRNLPWDHQLEWPSVDDTDRTEFDVSSRGVITYYKFHHPGVV